MSKNRVNGRTPSKSGERAPIEKSSVIRIPWLHRFQIEPEQLEAGNWTDVPFQIIKVEDFLGQGIIPHAIQVRAWIVIFDGGSLFLVSGTGSGKTLAIFLGILESLVKNRNTHCLILYPMKALAQDQEWRLRDWCAPYNLTVQRYDSSVSDKAKGRIREKPGEVMIITPDTLLMSLNATQNEKWSSYLTSPAMIWLDEFHAMSGTLGTTLCYLVRILYQLHPTLRVFVTSATLANAAEIAQLFPQAPKIIEGRSRHGQINFHIGTLENFRDVFQLVLIDEEQFLIFIENKQKIEELLTEKLIDRKVERYHADLTDQDRHLFLSQFANNDLRGLLCTSAVSLGVDLPSVKNIVLCGFPRNFSLLSQEMGRGTRDSDASGRVLLLLDNTKLIDNYYSSHPEELEADVRAYKSDPMVIDLGNVKILRGMVLFAIKLGLNTLDQLSQVFPEAHESGKLKQTLTWLFIRGLISKKAGAYLYFKEYADDYIHGFASTIRPGFPKYTYRLKGDRVELGSINAKDIPHRACIGNYYTKGNQSYLIEKIEKDIRQILVRPSKAQYRSKNLITTTVSMIRERKFKTFDQIKVRLAEFKVVIQPNKLRNYKITEDLREDQKEEITPDTNVFDLTYETVGVTFKFPQDQDLSLSPMVLYQLAKRILQNATVMISVSEREVDCYQNKDQQMLYFLDRSCPTGVSQQLYENLENILKRTYEVLAACPCVKGCDKCVIPFESNFLMPNIETRDTFRKDEILTLLGRFLGESWFVE